MAIIQQECGKKNQGKQNIDGERRIMQLMTREEMQRFLNKEAERGSDELEAFRNLADIIGIKYPDVNKVQKENTE